MKDMITMSAMIAMIGRLFIRRHQTTKLQALMAQGILFLSFAIDLHGQTPAQVAETAGVLSPQSQIVLARLSQLSFFPSPNWKAQLGALPDGEDPGLDDSHWPLANPEFSIPTDQAGWFRAWIEVPKFFHGYDLAGSRIWFKFRYTGGWLLTTTVYFNGRRVALGEDLEPIVMFDKAKPGDRILVAVRVPKSTEVKRVRDCVMRIEFSAMRPSPEDLRQQFLTAAALLKHFPNPALAKIQLETAINAVDFVALENRDQTKFDDSLRHAFTQLEALRRSIAQFSFILTGNAHIDAAWLWPWTETVDVVRRTFATATNLMEEYPDYTFTQSSAQYSEWIAEKYPQTNEDIKRAIKGGRWEIVGGMWVEPDLNLPDGESLVRQLLVGKRFFRSQYGVDVRIGWNPDSFGYTWQLPQIYKKSGIDYFVTQKLGSNETHKLPFKLFWWQSPDGSKVLTYFPNEYGNEDVDPARLATELGRARGFSPGLNQLMDLYGVSDHGGGPTRLILEQAKRWMSPDRLVPQMHFGTAQNYFSNVERQLDPDSPLWNYQSMARSYTPPASPAPGRIAIPTWKDELYYEFHRGVFTTQANEKRNLRESEERLLNAEKYASLAWLAGAAYPQASLTEAWKKTLFNQFHDLAAGSGIVVLYKDAERDYEAVRLATNEISQTSLLAIAANINTRAAGDVPILVFNPLAWKRSGLVTLEVQLSSATTASGASILDAQNQVVPSEVLSIDRRNNSYKLLLFVRDVPSLGYKVLHAVSGSRPFASDLKVNGLTLENAALRVTIDPKTGWITSLYDKQAQFETIAAGGQGNQLQTFADNPKCCDAWNIDPGTLDRINVIDKTESVELVENNSLRATIRITRTWQKSKFVQDITLYAGSDQVEITNDIDWHEKHILLKTAFPLAASSNNATYEIAYGTIERPTTRNNSWEQTRFEVAALRWADLGDGHHGFTLINEAKYGYDAKDNVLRLSLLRSPTSPDPLADQGHHHFSYSLYPHAGDWRSALSERRGYEYNYRLTSLAVAPHKGSLPLEYSYVTVSPQNVLLTALKKAEDSQALILRIFEWAGKDGAVVLKVPPGATAATVTNLMEQPTGATLKVINDAVTVPIHPFEILSLRVDYPKS